MIAPGPATAKLPRELVNGLERLAEQRGISRGALIRRLADAVLRGDLQLQAEVERAVEPKSQQAIFEWS